MDFAGFGLREAIFAFCVVAALYVVTMLAWLYRVEMTKRRKAKRAEAPPMVAPQVPAEPPSLESAGARDEIEDPPWVYDRPRAARAAPITPVVAVAPEAFEQQLQRSQQDQETRSLREEVAALRDEVLTLRDEVAAQKSAGMVSPQYSEAMAFAQRGLTAQDIADRCGISRGEAELVRALACGPANFDDEDYYGGDTRRHSSAV